MKGAVYYGPRDLRIEDVPEPTPAPGQVLIEVARNGICGSDLHTYLGASKGGATMHVPGVVLGHEFAGVVTDVGDGVDDLAVGTTVAVAPIEWCVSCYACLHSWPQMCRKLGLYGGTRLNIDFTDRVDESDPEMKLSEGRLLNTRSFLGYSWDCCGVQLNYDTFNLPSGLRRESRLYFTFSLAGLGSIGNENIGQPAQTLRFAVIIALPDVNQNGGAMALGEAQGGFVTRSIHRILMRSGVKFHERHLPVFQLFFSFLGAVGIDRAVSHKTPGITRNRLRHQSIPLMSLGADGRYTGHTAHLDTQTIHQTHVIVQG